MSSRHLKNVAISNSVRHNKKLDILSGVDIKAMVSRGIDRECAERYSFSLYSAEKASSGCA